MQHWNSSHVIQTDQLDESSICILILNVCSYNHALENKLHKQQCIGLVRDT